MLKPLATILAPDERFEAMVSSDGGPFGIEDLYALMRPLDLDACVPEPIRTQFDKARYGFIYSWFAYDLATLGEMQAIATLELALKHKRDLAQVDDVRKKDEGLGTLLGLAVSRGWLNSEDIPSMPSASPNGGKIYYLSVMRNDLFHGSSQLNPNQSLLTMQICFELICKLFPASDA